MQSPQESPSQPQASRRKLVRGVFAAPAILTVCSGSVAASSSLRCLNYQVTNSATAPAVTTGGDTWARVQLYSTGADPTKVYWVRGSELNFYKKSSNTVFMASTDRRQFNITTNALVGNAVADPNNATPSGKYAVVRFDASGNVVGVGALTGSGSSAVAGTCWASFSPTL